MAVYQETLVTPEGTGEPVTRFFEVTAQDAGFTRTELNPGVPPDYIGPVNHVRREVEDRDCSSLNGGECPQPRALNGSPFFEGPNMFNLNLV